MSSACPVDRTTTVATRHRVAGEPQRHVASLDQFRSLITKYLGIDADSLTDEALFRDDLGADSLDAFELRLAFEETFGIEIPDDEANPMQHVSDAVTYIETRVLSRPPRQPVEGTTDPLTENARSGLRRP